MPRNPGPNWNVEDATDSEIFAAIRYLDPDTRAYSNSEEIHHVLRDQDPDLHDETVRDDKNIALLLLIASLILLFGGVVFIWFR